jgi:hypothetical protein
VLILLRVARALVLFKLELADIGDPAHRRLGRRRYFDQVEPGLLSTANRLFQGHDPDLLAFFVQNANFGRSNLLIGAWTCRDGWSPDEWWSWNRCSLSISRLRT